MVTRMVLFVSLAVSTVATGIGQANYPDIPEHHWVFEDLAKLRKAGFLNERAFNRKFPEYVHRGGNWRYYRRELAAWTINGCKTAVKVANREENSCNLVGRLPVDELSTSRFKEVISSQSEFRTCGSLGKDFEALIHEFEPEIKALHENPSDLKHDVLNALYRLSNLQVSKPGSALVQFKDVPANHWAAKQVLELRKLGIMQGYPDGSF